MKAARKVRVAVDVGIWNKDGLVIYVLSDGQSSANRLRRCHGPLLVKSVKPNRYKQVVKYTCVPSSSHLQPLG